MSNSFDFVAHYNMISEIAKEPKQNIRPQRLSSDVSINAPDLLDPILTYRIPQNNGLVISRIECFTHSTSLQSVQNVFDVSAFISVQNSTGTRFISGLANDMGQSDYIITFQAPDVVQLIFTEVGGPGVYRACFRWWAWIIPSAKIGNFANMLTVTF